MTALEQTAKYGIPGYDPWRSPGGASFDELRASQAVGFFEDCLTHIKGELAGKPFLLEPWQIAIIANLFGWVRPDGTRRYREAMVFVPRKNGKTLLAAGICNYFLFCDGEPGAEIYAAAADRDQAALLFDVAKHQILNRPGLSKHCKICRRWVELTDGSASIFRVLSSDAKTKHGFNSHLVAIDELHAQEGTDLVDVLVTSTGARRQPLILYLTTSDFERPSICNSRHEYASQVRDGIIDDPQFLPVIYEASIDDDWTKSEIWEKANPNIGISISREYLERECSKAQESASDENRFKRLHLNIRTEQANRWIQMPTWDACDGAPEILKTDVCYAGLDLASVEDMTAFVLFAPRTRSLRCFFWTPQGARESHKMRASYLQWERDGYLTRTPGDVQDYDRIRADINKIGAEYRIAEIAIDRWNSTQLQVQLGGDGFTIVQFGQGYASMTAPTKELFRLLLAGELRHGGHPVLRWMARNVCTEEDPAGNLKPSKSHSFEKIDGIVAAIMALGRAMVREEGPNSIYETRGLVTL